MPTIADIAAGDSSFEILVAAVGFIDSEKGTDYLGTLADPNQSLTVFAPTDAAFGQLAVDFGYMGDPMDEAAVTTFLVSLGADTLEMVVLYHLVAGEFLAADVAGVDSVTTLQGGAIDTSMLPMLGDLEPHIDDPTLVTTDIMADNGVIHVIDRVLLPSDFAGNGPTIAEIAAGDTSFEILVAAIGFIDSELGTDYLGTLSDPEQSLTVFAPTDAAFGQLAADLGFMGDTMDEAAVTTFLVSLGAETLETVVLYHLAAGDLRAADVAMVDSITTLQGGEIDTTMLPMLGDIEPHIDDPSLVTTDIIAENGVVHVIDRVLLPVDFEGNGPSIADVAAGNADFSILVAAVGFIDSELGTSYLATLADKEQSLTVFAPTNAAFGQLAANLGFEGDTGDADAVTAFLVTLGAETLETVVLYHIVAGGLMASDIAGMDTLTTLQGGTIDATELPVLGDMEPDLLDPSLVATDIFAENGYVHVIDQVLLPVDFEGNDVPSITGTVIAASGAEGFDDNGSDFDMLREAVIAAGLADTLDDAGVDLTVFAPNDAAFIGLAQTLGYQGSDEEGAFGFIVGALRLLNEGGDPIELLTTILTYHVSGSSLQASQVLSAEMISTLQGGDLTVNSNATLGDADPDIADPALIGTDLLASNGIVHVLDGVLLPADLLQSDGANSVDFAIGTAGDDSIRTTRDDDFADGGDGNDNIRIGIGNDVALGGAGNDTMFGGRGDDVMYGDAGSDVMRGGPGMDMMYGGDGNDTVHGGQGNDVINGGAGNDTLRGGPGNDIFVFDADAGSDTVIGFVDGQDRIDLSAWGFSGFDDIEDLIDSEKNDVTITLDGATITLLHVDDDDLGAEDFIF